MIRQFIATKFQIIMTISLVILTIINFSLLLEVKTNTLYLKHTFNQSQSNFDLLSLSDNKLDKHINDVAAINENITKILQEIEKANLK